MEIPSQPRQMSVQLRILANFFRKRVDATVVHRGRRWAAFAAAVSLFLLRMLLLQGYFAVCYILAFYVLQNVILFLTPSALPSIQDEEEAEEHVYEIPEDALERGGDGDRPVVRKLGEFKLWKKLMGAAVLAFASTFVDLLDFPVFWPILLFYFVLVSASIYIKQRRHMQKYGYTFADFFKKPDKSSGKQ